MCLTQRHSTVTLVGIEPIHHVWTKTSWTAHTRTWCCHCGVLVVHNLINGAKNQSLRMANTIYQLCLLKSTISHERLLYKSEMTIYSFIKVHWPTIFNHFCPPPFRRKAEGLSFRLSVHLSPYLMCAPTKVLFKF